MNRTILTLFGGGGALAALLLTSSAASAAPPSDTSFSDAIADGKLILELRPRFEDVDQSGFSNQATAYTLRTHLGWETGAWHGLTGLVELSDVRGLGAEHYNTTVNGKTAYPVIGDPDQTRLNRLQLSWKATDWLTATVGRQRVLIDDQRFVGDANWRQNEQVFDAARADLSFGKLKANYIYLDHVSRVFGDSLDWTGGSQIANISYSLADPLRVEGFYYRLDFTTPTAAAKAASTATTGVKLTGKVAAKPFQITYGATYAREINAGRNPGRFRLNYTEADLGAAVDIYAVKAMYEQLQGDGVRGFTTPLATLHAFQGWADVFLTTPTKGVDDANLAFTVKPRVKLAYFSAPTITAVYHDFKFEQTAKPLGSEWDLQGTVQVTPKISGLIKYADYKGVAGFASRQKTWVGVEYKF